MPGAPFFPGVYALHGCRAVAIELRIEKDSACLPWFEKRPRADNRLFSGRPGAKP